jgi:TIR domain
VPREHRDEPDSNVQFDVFISHASEDKDSFVRSLAHALEVRRLRPWYDEFTLRPGDSLRRSIDHGLLTSQVGIVVLSPAFFGKRWPAYELDGLVQLHAASADQVAGSRQASRIIPIWHNVDAAEVARYSPSLANLVAIMSSDGVEVVADRVLKVLRPAGSTLLLAHAELTELGQPHGWEPPIVTDDWWLDAVEANAKDDLEGTFQEAMGWGHWGFPLPEGGEEPRERGHRLARAAAQMMWQRADAEEPICQVTPTEVVLNFIDQYPGLSDACLEHPSYLLSYAPQLALPGQAGWLQPIIDDTYEWARDRVIRQGLEADSAEGRERLVSSIGYLALRDVELVRAAPPDGACAWVQGDLHGPTTQVYEPIDYAGWLASDESSWLGAEMRDALLGGIAEWSVWPTWKEHHRSNATLSLLEWLEEENDEGTLIVKVRPILVSRLNATRDLLGLPESADILVQRLVSAGFIKKYRRRRPPPQ